MSTGFTVCTYNLGAAVSDYFNLCAYLKPELMSTLEPEESQRIEGNYRMAQEKTAEKLQGLADVYCLQEIGERLRPAQLSERPLLRVLASQGFSVIFYQRPPASLRDHDTAIALNPTRFTDITNHSIDAQIGECFTKDVAIATAVDAQSGQRIAFVSAHAPGFSFSKERLEKEDVADGDRYCSIIAMTLSAVGVCAIQVIGADMNANPEKWGPRFQIFSERGFQVLRTHEKTNVYPQERERQERELDFVMTKISIPPWHKISSLFHKTMKTTAQIQTVQPLGWDAEANASDHVPVFARIETGFPDKS